MKVLRVAKVEAEPGSYRYTVVLFERHPRRSEPDRKLAEQYVNAPCGLSVGSLSALLARTEKEMKSQYG